MRLSKMQLSVVIPVYNEEQTVGNIIERTKIALQQQGLDFEIIVVDDRSIDRSFEVAKRHSVRLFSLKQHLGKGYVLSLIHISEPTRRTPISYAVFCLKKKK